jgi:hypothetical protein
MTPKSISSIAPSAYLDVGKGIPARKSNSPIRKFCSSGDYPIIINNSWKRACEVAKKADVSKIRTYKENSQCSEIALQAFNLAYQNLSLDTLDISLISFEIRSHLNL